MSEDKGKKFLELIDEQSRIKDEITSIVTKLTMDPNGNYETVKNDLISLVNRNQHITKKINSVDES